MDRTLKNAIHKAWEAAHKKGEASEPDALTCFDLADGGEIEQMPNYETHATESQHRAQASPQVQGGTGAPTTIEKASVIPSAARIEKPLPHC